MKIENQIKRRYQLIFRKEKSALKFKTKGF